MQTVELVELAYYWVKPRYGKLEGLWTVAKWDVGSFWGIDGGEISPSVISGPIPRPETVPPADGALGRQDGPSDRAHDEPLIPQAEGV